MPLNPTISNIARLPSTAATLTLPLLFEFLMSLLPLLTSLLKFAIAPILRPSMFVFASHVFYCAMLPYSKPGHRNLFFVWTAIVVAFSAKEATSRPQATEHIQSCGSPVTQWENTSDDGMTAYLLPFHHGHGAITLSLHISTLLAYRYNSLIRKA